MKRHSMSNVTIGIKMLASNNLRKGSMTKQNKPYTNIPFNCGVYQEHHDTKNWPTNHDKCN